MEGEITITIGCLFEYYHEISLTPLLGMFKCGNFRLDRYNDMIWRHDTDTCMQEAGQQSTPWRHRPIISTSLAAGARYLRVISRLSDLFHRKSSWGHAPSITIYLLGIRFMCCVFNWGKHPLEMWVSKQSRDPPCLRCLRSIKWHRSVQHNTPCRAVSADLIRLLPSATSFTWNIVTVDVHNLLN